MTISHFNFQTYHFPGNCPTDDSRYKWILEHCYYLEIDDKTYEEAKANCATKFSNGGKLFEPMSLQVSELVWEEFKDTIISKGYAPWIGVNKQEAHSVYKYTSSGSNVSFTIPWLPGYEPRGNSSRCITMWEGAKWRGLGSRTSGCTSFQTSICEQ